MADLRDANGAFHNWLGRFTGRKQGEVDAADVLPGPAAEVDWIEPGTRVEFYSPSSAVRTTGTLRRHRVPAGRYTLGEIERDDDGTSWRDEGFWFRVG